MRLGFHRTSGVCCFCGGDVLGGGGVAPSRLGPAQPISKAAGCASRSWPTSRNFDPMQFSTMNFPLIKNLLRQPDRIHTRWKAVPSLATAWKIAPDNTSVTVTLRKDVKFHSGAPFNAEAVAATLKKAADPQKGKNVYATMSFVKDWTVVDQSTIRLNFNGPGAGAPDHRPAAIHLPDRPAGIDTVETKPAGTGAYPAASAWSGSASPSWPTRITGARSEPVSNEAVLTIFSEDAAATAALESGAVDIIYGGGARSAVRLKNAGYQLIQGPGPLVQVFRINTTRGPFRNAKFRQAFNYLMDRQGILRVGYAGSRRSGGAALGAGEPGLRRHTTRNTPSTSTRRRRCSRPPACPPPR